MVYVNTDTPYMVFYSVIQLWTRDTETCESSPLWAIWWTKLPEGPLSCEQWDLCWTCNMQGKLRWRWEAKQQRAETRVENKPRTHIHRSHYHHFQGQRVCMCVLTGYGKKPWDPRIKLGTFEGGESDPRSLVPLDLCRINYSSMDSLVWTREKKIQYRLLILLHIKGSNSLKSSLKSKITKHREKILHEWVSRNNK